MLSFNKICCTYAYVCTYLVNMDCTYVPCQYGLYVHVYLQCMLQHGCYMRFTKLYMECTLHMYYTYAYVIPVAPSVTEAVATLVTPNENRTEHSITVTCTVRPESDADMCVVMAMADGRMTRSGKYVHTK